MSSGSATGEDGGLGVWLLRSVGLGVNVKVISGVGVFVLVGVGDGICVCKGSGVEVGGKKRAIEIS